MPVVGRQQSQRRREALRVGVLLSVLLAAAPRLAQPAEQIAWPRDLYNPQPQADDLLLPLPCGGAMAFRSLPTPGPDQGYPVTGPFARPDGTPYLLVGKYEVSELQAQALAGGVAGRPCPAPQAALQRPALAGWWEAVELADRYSLWLTANAESIPACDAEASPCLPRVDGVPAYLRLPTAAEWEYVARGGLSVPAGTFAAPRYPMPGGLGAHAWYADNAQGAPQPIGGRAASPLGLHDLYGNVAEWVLEAGPGLAGPMPPFAALALGGHAGSPAADLAADRRWVLAPFAAAAAPTGLRLLVSVPLFTSPEKVRQAEQRRLARPDQAVAVAPDQAPPPPQPLGGLRVTANLDAEVLVDGERVGQVRPGEPFETAAIAVGERRIEVRAAGYQAVGYQAEAQTHRIDTGQRVEAEFRLTAIAPSKPAVAEPAAPILPMTAPTPLAPRYPFEPEMIALPRGEFWMGSPEGELGRRSNEGPRHKVRIAPFAIGKTEVTFAQYDAFCESTGREKPYDQGWGRGQRPVIGVSWVDAVVYAVWLSNATGERYRLPSEAEWEYAARAGTETAFWTGRCIDTSQANYRAEQQFSANDTQPLDSTKSRTFAQRALQESDSAIQKLGVRGEPLREDESWVQAYAVFCGVQIGVSRGQTVPVGSLPANPWGLHEVHGNVREWVQDYWHGSYAGAPTDGSAWEAGGGSVRLVRGGSWNNVVTGLRAAERDMISPRIPSTEVGFRIARTLSP